MDSREQELIQNSQRGELADFGLLYDKYVRKIYDFIYYKTHHKETAEDLTSTVFLKAVQGIRSFELQRGTFQAWLYRIARNTVIDHYRTRKEEKNIDDVWDLHTADDIPRDVDTRQRLEVAFQHIQKLPSLQRDIIMLRVWGDLPYRDIAEIVGKTEANCKMIFSRVVNRLRREEFIAMLLLFGELIRYSR